MMRTLFLFILTINLVFAQSFPALDGFVATDSSKIDVAAINKTAQALKDNGLEPLVLFIDGSIGHSLKEAEAYLDNAIEHYFPVNSPNRLIIFIGTKPLVFDAGERPLYIEYSDTLGPVLDTLSGTDSLVDVIRNRVIIPHLVSGDFNTAVEAALTDINNRYLASQGIANSPRIPSTSQATNPPVTAPTVNQDSNGINPIFFLLLIPLLGILFFAFRKRSDSGKAITAEEDEIGQKLRESKAKISNSLIELSESQNSDNYFPQDPEKQHHMKGIIDLLKAERAEELQNLKTDYQKNYKKLNSASKKYKSLTEEENSKQHSLQEFKNYIPEYQNILNDLVEAKEFSSSLAVKHDELKTEITQISNRQETVADLLKQSKTVYSKMNLTDWPPSDEIYFGFDEALYEIKNISEKTPFKALKDLRILEADLQTANDAVAELSSKEKEIIKFKPWLEGKRAEGYLLDNADKLVGNLQEHILLAKNLLKQNEYKVLDAQVEEVKELSEDLFEGSRHFVSLYQENKHRFQLIEADSLRVKKVIEKAALLFDLVDDYARESWTDIKGNGSEAQKAADQAYEFYEKAKELNSFDEQSFDIAADMLDLADVELKRSEELAASIEKRLKNLQHAQKVARDELELVKRDLAKDWSYLKQEKVDKIVGDKAEDLLRSAAQIIEKTELEFAKNKPNWLIIIDWTQKADRLVDEALETMRSEEEAMKHREIIMISEKTEAEIAVERVLEYARVHTNDIDHPTKSKLENAQEYYLKAIQLEKNTKALRDKSLAEAFEQAANSFDQAEQLASQAFELAEKDFEEMEILRKDAAEAIANAQESYKNLLKIAKRGRVENTVRSSLYALANSIPQYYSGSTKSELLESIKTSKDLEKDIARAQTEVRGYIKQVETQQRKERLQRLEMERRRRARQNARRRVSWGSTPMGDLGPIISSNPSRRTRSRTTTSRMPVARRSTPVRLPTIRSSSRSSSHKSGGGWGGSRKSGGGW